MEVLHDRVAGLDVHKKMVVACVRTPGEGRARRAETREFETFVDDLERRRDWLVAEGVTHVAMEATRIYWKPVWFVLEEAELELDLVNLRNMRMVPGRKTDVSDAGWIAHLLEHPFATTHHSPHRSADHLDPIEPAQQAERRDQRMGHSAGPAPCPSQPHPQPRATAPQRPHVTRPKRHRRQAARTDRPWDRYTTTRGHVLIDRQRTRPYDGHW